MTGLRDSRGRGLSCWLDGWGYWQASVADSEGVVVGVGKAEAEAFDVFDDPVAAFDTTVGGPGGEVVEELFSHWLSVVARRTSSGTGWSAMNEYPHISWRRAWARSTQVS